MVPPRNTVAFTVRKCVLLLPIEIDEYDLIGWSMEKTDEKALTRLIDNCIDNMKNMRTASEKESAKQDFHQVCDLILNYHDHASKMFNCYYNSEEGRSFPAVPHDMLDRLTEICVDFHCTSSFQKAAKFLVRMSEDSYDRSIPALARVIVPGSSASVLEIPTYFMHAQTSLGSKLEMCDRVHAGYQKVQKIESAAGVAGSALEHVAQWRIFLIRALLSELQPNAERPFFLLSLDAEIILKYGPELNDEGFVHDLLGSVATLYDQQHVGELLEAICKLDLTPDETVNYFNTVLGRSVVSIEQCTMEDLTYIQRILDFHKTIPSNASTTSTLR